jgi:hypothetical protein
LRRSRSRSAALIAANASCQGQQAFPGGRKTQSLARAIEQRHTVMRLDGLDLMGERRLAHVHAFSGRCQLARFGDGHERAEMADFNHRPVSF